MSRVMGVVGKGVCAIKRPFSSSFPVSSLG